MNLINKKLAKDVFDLIKTKINIVERANIHEYFFFLTLDLIKKGDKELVREYVDLFETFEKKSSSKNLFYRGFFFALDQLLSVAFKISKVEGDMIERKYFEESFKKFLGRWGIED